MKKLSIQKLSHWTMAVSVMAVAVAPISASAATDTTTVNATVDSVISVDSDATVAISVVPTSSGAQATASDTIAVDSNDADGYNLTLENDATLTMAGPGGNTLAKASGTYATPAALGTNSWGYRVDSLGSFGVGGTTTYAGVEDTAQNIRSTTATATAEVTTVIYGVNVNTSIPAGVYSDSVTYTATVK